MRVSLFTTIVLLIILLFSCQVDEDTAKNKPNFLFILTDDQSFQALHALGNREIITPAMDRLVEEGTTFTNAYNMGGWHGAVCVASRAMLNSGRTLWNAKETSDNDFSKGMLHDKTWSAIFRKYDYDTYFTGKWHVPIPTDSIFDHVSHVRPGMPPGGLQHRCPECYNRPQHRMDTTWRAYDATKSGFWEGGKHWSEVVREDAISFIQHAARDNNPFFMYVAFNAPHDPRQAPKEFLDMYDPDSIALPENYLDEYPWFQDIMAMGDLKDNELLYDFPQEKIDFSTGDLRDELLAPFPRTPYAVKKHRHEYYAIVSHLDTQIGLILEELRATGMHDNTYIIFTSDHGLSVGQHGMVGKQSLLEHSAKVPFIVTGPGVPRGQKIAEPIYMQDVMPTSLEWAGLKVPDFVEFKSFSDLITNPSYGHYPSIYGAYRSDRQRMIVKNDFKLLLYPLADQIFLFNLSQDSLEMNNLADDSAYRGKVTDLYRELKQLQKEMSDTLLLDRYFARLN